MNGKVKIAKGRVEEAAGALTNNDKLRLKGQKNQFVGKVQEGAKKILDKAKKAVDE